MNLGFYPVQEHKISPLIGVRPYTDDEVVIAVHRAVVRLGRGVTARAVSLLTIWISVPHQPEPDGQTVTRGLGDKSEITLKHVYIV